MKFYKLPSDTEGKIRLLPVDMKTVDHMWLPRNKAKAFIQHTPNCFVCALIASIRYDRDELFRWEDDGGACH